ncbi:MAG: glycosyltransferase [Prevotellaceae bacterium]|jgi:spore maturation protein CgeB|nr:glycosyltransferase [Prevotellaceae bacterium]
MGACTESYDTPIHPFKGLLKWLRKFSFNRKKLKKQQDAKFNVHVIDTFLRVQPDLVFILNGDILFVETLDLFRKTSKVVLWMYDALSRYPASKEHIDHVDVFYSYEMADVENYRRQGKAAYFLPQACDENDYYPTNTEKDIDILFVGVLYRYNKRIKLLKAVTNRFADKKILIVGIYKPWYKNPFKWLFREKRHIYTNKNVPVNEVNNYYSRARIVLNIHHETQQQGANPKVFEICGAGQYQICDANPFIESLFPNSEIGLYCNEIELLANIEDALQNDKSEKARCGREIVLAEHTFKHRIKEILIQIDDITSTT